MHGRPSNHRAARFVEFEYQRRVGGTLERHPARGRVFKLTGGFRLLVARDIQERRETERLFTTALPWSVILMLTLGLVGGALMSRNLLRRLDSDQQHQPGDHGRRIFRAACRSRAPATNSIRWRAISTGC